MAIADVGIGAQVGLRDLLMQRMAAQQYADHLKQQDFENQRQLAGDQRASQAQAIEQQRYAAQDAQRQATAAEAARKETYAEADKLGEQHPPGTEYMPSSPAVATMQAGGRGELLQPRMTLPSRQMTGGGVTPEASGSFPEAQPAQGFLRTTTRTEAQPEKYIKTATQKQMDTLADNQRQADEITRQREADAERAKHDRAMENKPQSSPTIVVHTVDADGNPVTRVVPKTAGSEFAAPANAATANRVASAETVNEVGSDIVRKLSDPKFKAAVGPAMGRYSTLRDFIGNPPPEYSELAGQIESYALANMGVHGMRSAQGAEQVRRLLDQRHTPESLAATIKGLNDFSTRFAAHNKPKSGAAAPATNNDPLGIR